MAMIERQLRRPAAARAEARCSEQRNVKRSKLMRYSGFLVICAGLMATVGGCSQMHRGLSNKFASKPVRAIWVTRWDYTRSADITKIMDNCARAGFNTVMFQVRGEGTVFYRSKIEPWSEDIGGRDPGFDPLQVACQEAHRRGLSLHAWVNVIPGWRGKEPPANPRQLYNAHPDWFWRDSAGRRQPLGWYVSLNPLYPEVRRHLVAVMREIVEGYAVDGLHLDYVRFPNEWNDSYPAGATVPDYPRDPRTLAMFRRATGKTPDTAPAAWNAWRTAAITQVVRDVRVMTRRVKPQIALTAAVGASMDEAKRLHFQDVRQWIQERLVDAVFPMNYESDLFVYSRRLDEWSSVKARVPVITGVMFDKRDGRLVAAQVDRAARSTEHFCAFAYNSLFERLDRTGRPIYDDQSGSRAALRRRVLPRLSRL